MSNEKKLLDLADELGLNVPSIVEPDEEQIPQNKENLEDVSDLIIKNERSEKILTNLDYLILSGISSGKSLPSLATTYNTTESYIKKAMRSDSGSKFLKEQAKQKADLALSLSTTTVYEGVLKYQELIADLFNKKQDSLALSYLFGKQSLMEVQAGLHKQQANVEEGNSKDLLNLFASIAVTDKAD